MRIIIIIIIHLNFGWKQFLFNKSYIVEFFFAFGKTNVWNKKHDYCFFTHS